MPDPGTRLPTEARDFTGAIRKPSQGSGSRLAARPAVQPVLKGWILKPGRKRPDYPAMPPQEMPTDELQQLVEYVLHRAR